ncbi:MAG TPA: 50S ribosomal protein L23 [Steroidobacteraceae bacterium]|nr:50S ribosomal protein L23 [Steroidobacteraceae bacterium]
MSPAAKAAKFSKEDTAVKTEKAPKAAKPASKKVVDIKDAPKKVTSQEKLIAVLLAPHITEKTSLAMQNTNTYSFRVRRDSTKPDIKAAVELMFNVKVDGVQVVNETGKTRRFGKLMGRTQDIKKAYVRLAPGQTIDYEAKIKA